MNEALKEDFSEDLKTPQGVFNHVWNFLNKQGRAAGSYANCAYRTPEGFKCAAGCLIKDEFYDATLEGRSSTAVRVREALVSSGVAVSVIDDGLISDLQALHDGKLAPVVSAGEESRRAALKSWRIAMHNLAKAYKLTVPSGT